MTGKHRRDPPRHNPDAPDRDVVAAEGSTVNSYSDGASVRPGDGSVPVLPCPRHGRNDRFRVIARKVAILLGYELFRRGATKVAQWIDNSEFVD